MVLVPNVRAMSEKAATKVMQDKGFKVVAKPVAGINALGLGYVSYTDPVPGSKARKGSTITLYLV
ncbi:MAG: PASTA domain-containing protein [Propionibacteriaceae bacterium]